MYKSLSGLESQASRPKPFKSTGVLKKPFNQQNTSITSSSSVTFPKKSLLKTDRKAVIGVSDGLLIRGAGRGQAQSKAVTNNNNNKATPAAGSKDLVLSENLLADPLRWFRDEKSNNKQMMPQSLSRNPVMLHIGPYQAHGILEPTEEEEKLITIGGYIINMEKALPRLTTTVRPKISSNSPGIEIEIRIANCDPSLIRFEKRYNAILVIGVLDQGSVANKGKGLEQEEWAKSEFESELTEVVNIFVPRDVSLARVSVSEPDSKGRILIKAP